MITVVEGLTGAGKTYFMTRLLLAEQKLGYPIHANYPLVFPNENENVNRFHTLPDIYHLTQGIVAIDEGQKFFDARRWQSFPISFAEKLAQHRKHHLDIYTTSQSFSHIDKRFRDLVHELYTCNTVFRWPRNERDYPLLQLVIVTKKTRKFLKDEAKVRWVKDGRSKWLFISRFWTKKLYETYADVGLNRIVTKTYYAKNKWTTKIYQREIVNTGKARL